MSNVETRDVFVDSDIKRYVQEFGAEHRGLDYLSTQARMALVDSWILRRLVIRGPELSQTSIREVRTKMFNELFPDI